MQKDKQALGKMGENLAREYLTQQGYSLLAANWRWGRAEADIIALAPEGILVFVEVKTRSHAHFGAPDEAVSNKKQQLLYDLAGEFMYQRQYDGEIRFDIISIIWQEPTPSLEHWKDAFFPTW